MRSPCPRWLARHGVAREWDIAPPLAAAGVDLAWCERAATALAGPALEPGLEWVASTFSITALLAEMKESTLRISELVAAIKSYSQMDRASMQQIEVTDGIDSALVMLGPKLRSGVAVVRGYSADTGPGMSPQVASRAFDAFYTTKDTGKGTGLGLDIARRTIVERHGGLITIDSEPGNTVLRVRLPIRMTAQS